MKYYRLAMAAAAAVMMVAPLAAQSHSHGYVVLAPGAISGDGDAVAVLGLAVGGEGLITPRFGVGAEVGGVGLNGSKDSGFGLASVNAYYHVPREESKFDPFVTGGYSKVFPFSPSLVNFGGGVNWWAAQHLGVKFVFKDHVYLGSDGPVNLATFGVGVTFR